MSAFLNAVNVASIAIILAVCVDMSRDSFQDWKTAFIAVLGLLLILVFRTLNTALIVLGGAVLGYILYLL